MQIPKDYRIFYFDSASQVWHSIMTNVVEKRGFHFVNGSFSEKVREASHLMGQYVLSSEAPWGVACDFSVKIPANVELITACYNETSTGVKMTNAEVRALSKKNPKPLLAIDVTSCGGCVPLNIKDADIWYFSVQKAFGLPSGLGIGIISPRAFERSVKLAESGKSLAGIWSWPRLDKTMRDDVHQTQQTPNILAIYLLGKQCERWNKDGGLAKRVRETLAKKELFDSWIRGRERLSYFVHDPKHRSDTTFVVKTSSEDVSMAHEILMKKKIELGYGYTKIKKETFRVANFPAVTEQMLEQALGVLAKEFGK
jgi:phosphoserine aminotransferase